MTGTITVERVRLRVRGVVQGVGFRPFVHRLALRHGLSGFVFNDVEGVALEAEGSPDDVTAFVSARVQRASARPRGRRRDDRVILPNDGGISYGQAAVAAATSGAL